ncbi:MAG: aminoacyl-tRNA hydrolase [Desulfohalobium sp.]
MTPQSRSFTFFLRLKNIFRLPGGKPASSFRYAGIVTGLGNSGTQYASTRHNMGFLVLSALQHQAGGQFRENRLPLRGRTWQWFLQGQQDPWLLLAPQTYMNHSGEAVAGACSQKGLCPGNLLVVHDDLDLPFGSVRLKQGGGLAGHRGLASIAQWLQTKDFDRLRVGIGRPEAGVSIVDHVLSGFTQAEQHTLEGVLSTAAEAVEAYCLYGPSVAKKALESRG